MFLHRREIMVIMQQRAAMLDAEGADDDVGRLADREAQRSQFAIIPGGAAREITVEKWHERISTQSALDALGMSLVPRALKDLEQDEIADQERFSTGGGFQFGDRRRPMTSQVGDPDGAIDQNHARIMTDAACGPAAFRRDRLPNPIP